MNNNLQKVNEEFRNLFNNNQKKIDELTIENSQINQAVDNNTNFINNINKLFEKQD